MQSLAQLRAKTRNKFGFVRQKCTANLMIHGLLWHEMAGNWVRLASFFLQIPNKIKENLGSFGKNGIGRREV
jgi:hypothetical protein